MKKLSVFVFALLSVLSAAAQELSVKSFEAKVTDLTAKVDPVLDLNGSPCALIRVQIACKGCAFSGNIVGRPQEKPGEYLVWVPAGTRRLKIAHPDFLPLTYEFNLKIEKNCTYELRITLPQHTAAIPQLNSQFLVLTVVPADAIVLVNDVLQTTEGGVLSKELPYGEHTYRVEAPMYHPRRGTFTVTESGKTELAVALDPAFGYLAVTSAPESGARVLVDGEQVGTTPYKSGRMASGSYQVQVLKEGYYPQMEPVEIADNRTTALNLSLKASFAAITLQAADPKAEIWVSGKRYGTGSWTGRLEAGTYSVESRCEGYEKALQSIEVEAGRPQTIRLAAQAPIYGILKVTSTPVGAAVKLDGKPLGETPLLTNKVLAGAHALEVSMPGYAAQQQRITVFKGKACEVGITLSAAEVNLKKALEALKDKRYEEAVPLLETASEEGDTTALFELMKCYYNGTGCPKDRTAAYRLWQKGVEKGVRAVNDFSLEYDAAGKIDNFYLVRMGDRWGVSAYRSTQGEILPCRYAKEQIVRRKIDSYETYYELAGKRTSRRNTIYELTAPDVKVIVHADEYAIRTCYLLRDGECRVSSIREPSRKLCNASDMAYRGSYTDVIDLPESKRIEKYVELTDGGWKSVVPLGTDRILVRHPFDGIVYADNYCLIARRDNAVGAVRRKDYAEIIPFRYRKITVYEPFGSPLPVFIVESGERYGAMDYTGKELLPCKFKYHYKCLNAISKLRK